MTPVGSESAEKGEKKERKSHPVKLSAYFKVFSFMNDITDLKLLSAFVAS